MSELDDIAGVVAQRAHARGCWIAVAESLTGGLVSAALARAEGAAHWYRGGVVAYAEHVKHDLLAVPEGPVVSDTAARTMALRVRELLGADLAIALSGSGGPDPQDGQPPGTVFLAAVGEPEGAEVVRLEVPGDPGQVCATAATRALRLLASRLEATPSASP